MRRLFLALFGIAFGVWLTWLAFRNTDWPAIIAILQHSSLSWMVVAALFLVSAHVVRAHRWNILLKSTVPPVAYRHVFASVMIGALAQLALPLKAGLLFRSIAFSRITGISVSKTYGSATLDRLPELMTLGVFVIAAMISLPTTDTFVIDRGVFGTDEPITFSGTLMQSVVVLITGAVAIRLGLLIGLYLKRDFVIRWIGALVRRFHRGSGARIEAMLGQFADALAVMNSRSVVAKSLSWTVLFWLLFMGGHAAVFQSLGIEWDWRAPLFSVLLTAVSMSLPGAPGFVGGWHLAVVMALVITTPGLESAEMKAAGIMTHAVVVTITALMGAISLVTEQVAVTDLAVDADALTHE